MIIGNAISICDLRKKSSGNGYDADAQAFITATGISGTNATATNKLVIDLKAANIWTKMKAIYPFVGTTSASQKFNLKDSRDLDAAFRLAFVGGGTFSANGYQPNGINAYANTFLIPSPNLPVNNTHLSYYSRTTSNGLEVEIGCRDTSLNTALLEIRTSGITYGALNSLATYTSFTDSDSKGMYTLNRTASNVVKIFKNNTIGASGTTASTSAPITYPITIGAFNAAGTTQYYSAKQCAFASIGDGLTDAEVTSLYNAVQTFNTTLSRQV